METRTRPAARAILLTEDWQVLLVRLSLPRRRSDFWMTPGGGIKPGEAPHVALAREVWEETGRRITSDKIRDELWNLRREFIYNGERVANHERFFLVETERFEARATSLDDGDESDWFDGFKWWPVAELPDLSCDFSPTSLGRLLRELRTEGPPRSPLTIEV